LLVDLRKSRFDQRLEASRAGAERANQRIPCIRRVAQPEPRRSAAIDATILQIGDRSRVLAQVAPVKLIGLTEDREQPVSLRLLLVATLERNLEVEHVRECFDGFGEAAVLVRDDEVDRIAVRAATKAMIEALVRTDRERGRFFVMKGAKALVAAARFFQRDARADHIEQIGTGDQFMEEGLRNAPAHARATVSRAQSIPTKAI
jgi:hypothetical protein